MTSEDRYVFFADWYDQQASLNRKFYLALYLTDKTIDIVLYLSLTLPYSLT